MSVMRWSAWARVSVRGSLALVLALVLVSPALARQEKRPPVEVVRAVIGFGGEDGTTASGSLGVTSGARALPDRYAPLRVWLSSEKGFSGLMVLEYPQDGTQSARVVVSASATPGVVTPVDAVVCMPRSMPKITLSLIDANGNEVLKRELAEVPNDREMALYGSLDREHVYVLSVGRSSLSTAATTTVQLAAPRIPGQEVLDDADWFAKVAVAPSGAEDMPRNPGAFDTLEAMVIAPESLGPVDPRVIESVRRWTLAGGKLVLLVSTGGSAWRGWLPEGSEYDFVDVGEPARVETPPELRTMLVQMRELATRRDPALTIAEAAGEVSARALSLREAGDREGWRTRWSVGGGRALLAEGPVGFGFVTILGVEPERLGAIADPRVTRRAWRDALRAPLETWRRGNMRRTESNSWAFDNAFQASGSDLATRIGLSSVLNELSKAYSINPSSFLVITGSMGVLAIVLGVADYFWLGALRRRHLGWATALGWIGVASVVALAVPALMRGGDSAVSRWQVVDARSPRDAAANAIAHEVVSSFVQHRAEISLQDLPREGWYRGVSAVNSMYGQSASRGVLLPALVLRESPGDPTAGCVPPGVEQPQWTFRSIMGEGPTAAPDITLAFEGSEPTVEVALAAGATIESGRLECGRATYSLRFEQVGGAWRGRGTPDTGMGAFERQSMKVLGESGSLMQGAASGESLWLAQRTELSQDARLASGRWARVHLLVRGPGTGLSTGIQEKGTMTRVVRALVELPDSRRFEARDQFLSADIAPVERRAKGQIESRPDADGATAGENAVRQPAVDTDERDDGEQTP